MPISPVQMTRSALLDALAEGAVVATGNARLARSLAAEFDRRMLAQGRAAWSTPAVLPWSAWLLELYAAAAVRSVAPLPRVLSAEQAEQVWADVIRQDGPRLQQALLRIDATGRRARESWKLLREWQLDLADRRFAHSENPEAFRRWALKFRSLSDGRGEAVEADVPNLLLPLLATGACPLPPRLLLAGFYELTPARQTFAEALREAGCPVDWGDLRGQPGRARRLRADDARHEMRLATGWARQILQEQPQARIGIVAPDLAARRSALAQVLGQVLDPAALAPGAPLAPRPWNLSLGQPLSDQPIVATALRLLRLMQQPCDTETLGILLLSPHWALPRAAVERRVELERRALLDRRIRDLGDTRLRLSSLYYETGGFKARGNAADGPGATGEDEERISRPWHSKLLAARCGALLEASRELPARAPTSGWAAVFTAWLTAAGWGAQGGGGRPLDSHEFQAVEAWNALLSRFSSLTDFAGSLSVAEALALLGRLAGETLFQPRGADAPVQVLGLYEAIGQSFDYLWVMGLHDAAWPPAAAPDPFIPLGLQRERGLPHSGPDLELAWAARVTDQLGAAAAEVVFSHPAREGNEALACSPLIATLPELDAGDLPGSLESRWHLAVRESARAEPVPVPAPVALRNPDVRGGSRVLGDQAACPFKAFATHRLGARPLERPQAGLDAARKGSLLHRVLERLWQDLRNQANLLALDDAALLGLLRGKIGEVLEEQRRRSPATFTERFRALEARRLEERLLAWLELERRRSPFTVTASEQQRRFEAGGLRLGVKIDRIDRLEDGAQVVLDYKTGKVRPSAWFGARPEEPQLPLYGVVSRSVPEGGDIAAVAFAQIRPEHVRFSGVVRGAGVLPELPSGRKGELQQAAEHWPAVLDAWAAELERLAAAFSAGEATVDPKHGLKTCEASYCELAPLCRVRESLPDLKPRGVDEDADEGAEDGADD
jgi:probable DNA repair protein